MILQPYIDAYDGLSDHVWRVYNPGRQIGIFRHRFITHDYLSLLLFVEGFYKETLPERNAAINETVNKGLLVEVQRIEKIRCGFPVGFSLYRIPHAPIFMIDGDEIDVVDKLLSKFYRGKEPGLACGSLVPMDRLLAKLELESNRQGAIEFLIETGHLLEAPSEFLRDEKLYGRHLFSPSHYQAKH